MARELPYLKATRYLMPIFNAGQIDGLSKDYYAKAVPTIDPVAPIDHAKEFLVGLQGDSELRWKRANYAYRRER